MNQSLPRNHSVSSASDKSDGTEMGLASYLDLIIDGRRLIAGITLFFACLGITYAIIATPVYQANMLVQVEDNSSSPVEMFGQLAGALDMKSVSSAEIEILKSRSIVGRAARSAGLDVSAEPKRFPLLGNWIARGAKEVSSPGIFGLGGYTWGAETIAMDRFDVAAELEGAEFNLKVTGAETYEISIVGSDEVVQGRVGETLTFTPWQAVIKTTAFNAKPGAVFVISRNSAQNTIETLQRSLAISEKGKQSGIIGVTLEGADRVLIARVLNELGSAYIRQNVERKSEEAQKSLSFLETQLPIMKETLEAAEARYNALRNERGTVNLDEEAKSILQQAILSQTRLVELKQEREALLTRFQETNPAVEAITRQIQTLNTELRNVNRKIKKMPSIEQDVLRLTRDVKVSTDLYASLLNSAQQLRLVKASKVGNARILDEAAVSRLPVRPNRNVVILMSSLTGLFLGITCALLRSHLFGGVGEPHEVEQKLGLPVSAAIPHSQQQEAVSAALVAGAEKVAVLATLDPTDLAVEALRSFRTSLQFSMLHAKNRIVMITGPTPGVGKSFVSVNFAAVLAATGKKVLLIDADLRKGYLQKYFGLSRANGLSEVISGQIAIAEAIHINVMPCVDFVSTGVLPPRPAELMEHPAFAAILKQAADKYDFIVIDTAPILAVADAMIVAPHAGAIFSVVRGQVSTLGEIEESTKRLGLAGNFVGVVFNGLRHRSGRYGFGFKYGKYRYAQYKY